MPQSLYSQSFKNVSDLKEIEKFQEICNFAKEKLREEIKAKKLAAIDVALADEDLEFFTKLAQETEKFKKILVLGVGGSSLGGKTLSALKFQEKLEFLESIDPQTINNCLSKIDLKDTYFLVISKSGETIETICQTLIILGRIQKEKITDFDKQFLFITESETNSLAKIAKEIGANIVNHPQKIGGRYSCFCVVGLLPAAIVGLDIKKIRLGARKILENFLYEDDISNSCAMQLALYSRGFGSNVIMPYVDNLKNFTDWYRQLWAESLGKNGFGSTPINSMGTVDQHSQLQLYLEGPNDKFFTFITTKNHHEDLLVKDLPACATLFGGKKLSEIVAIEQQTTIEVLHRKKLPIRIFELEELNEESLGGLMMLMFLETILIAYAKNINPFDQPAVELRKVLAKEILAK